MMMTQVAVSSFFFLAGSQTDYVHTATYCIRLCTADQNGVTNVKAQQPEWDGVSFLGFKLICLSYLVSFYISLKSTTK